jgi:hypothetical protein
VKATCGAEPLAELSRNSIEDAYAEITSEARNQYTLGYNVPQPTTGSSAYRSIEVSWWTERGLKVAAKDGYFASSDRPVSASCPITSKTRQSGTFRPGRGSRE